MRFRIACAAATLALTLPLSALARSPVEVEVLDRQTGEVMPVYWHDGARHIAGEPGREYEIRLCNRGRGRLLAVTSVDGVNVITGETAAPFGSGYVLDPWSLVEIDGWRKSMDEVAAFYFTALPDSYAARTGRPDNVGVIGVALFREAKREVSYLDAERERSADAAAAAPPAPAANGAAESRADSKAAQSAELARAEAERLGTGHGRRLDSGARYTAFERASDSPDEVVRIYYDSRRNLVARGIIPRPHDRFADRQPEPFPAGFVPDP
jgi:hypothetical protein